MPSIREDFEDEEFYLQYDGTPQHYHSDGWSFLDGILANRLIGQRGFIEYLPLSPEPTPLCFLWGYLKDRVYAIKPATVIELSAAIKRECTEIPRDCLGMDSNASHHQQCLDQSGR